MVLPQFQYKDNLPLSSRLAIAQTYVCFDGYHDLVTELATDFQTNRQQMSSRGSLPSYPDPSPWKNRVCLTESQPLTPPTGFWNRRMSNYTVVCDNRLK